MLTLFLMMVLIELSLMVTLLLILLMMSLDILDHVAADADGLFIVGDNCHCWW